MLQKFLYQLIFSPGNNVVQGIELGKKCYCSFHLFEFWDLQVFHCTSTWNRDNL